MSERFVEEEMPKRIHEHNEELLADGGALYAQEEILRKKEEWTKKIESQKLLRRQLIIQLDGEKEKEQPNTEKMSTLRKDLAEVEDLIDQLTQEVAAFEREIKPHHA